MIILLSHKEPNNTCLWYLSTVKKVPEGRGACLSIFVQKFVGTLILSKPALCSAVFELVPNNGPIPSFVDSRLSCANYPHTKFKLWGVNFPSTTTSTLHILFLSSELQATPTKITSEHHFSFASLMTGTG